MLDLENINKNNLGELIKLSKKELEGKVYKIEADIVYDADINPRQIDKKYAESIPLSAPPVVLGLLEDTEDDFYGRLFIIDGNHRMYSWKNVYNSKHCLATINKYKNMDEAIIDAFNLNINHGRRLSDAEIFSGLKRIAVSLKKKNKNLTYDELCKIINIPKTSFLEYIHWDKIEKILNENNNGEEKKIEKIKASSLYLIVKMKNENIDFEKRKEYIRIFYDLTKDLSTRKSRELIRYFLKTERICNYEEYTINKSLEVDSANDKIAERSKEIVMNKVEQNTHIEETYTDTKKEQNKEINQFNKIEDPNKNSTVTETYKSQEIISYEENQKLDGFDKEEDTEAIPDPDDFIQTTINKPIIINETITAGIEETIDDEQDVSTPMITRPANIISNTEGKKIDFILKKDNKENKTIQENKIQKQNNENELVTYKGNVRPLKFTTVLENIVTDLQEDVISSNALLSEVLEKNAPFHRQELEEHKAEYLAILNNVYSLVKKMMLKLSKVNKDFNNEN